MRRLVMYLLLAETFAVTTFGLGWWSVPIVAALWGMASNDEHPARTAAICATLGWATLLVLAATRGSVQVMGEQLGGVMKVPAAALYALTLVFPALLAWSAARLVPSVRRKSVSVNQDSVVSARDSVRQASSS